MHDACMALAHFEQSLCTDGAKPSNKNENTEKNFYYKERVKGTTTKMENSNEKLKQGTGQSAVKNHPLRRQYPHGHRCTVF